MQKINLIKRALLALTIAGGMLACTDPAKDEGFNDQESDVYNVDGEMEDVFSNIENITIAAIDNQGDPGGRILQDDPVLTCVDEITLNLETKTIVVDFGTDDCEGLDGRVRKGKVIVKYTGGKFVAGTTITTTLDNFSIDGIKVQGTKILKNISTSVTEPVFQVEIKEGKLIWPDGTFAERSSNTTHSYTISEQQVKLMVNGSAVGKTKKGVMYSTMITQPLEFRLACVLDGVFIAVRGHKTITTDKLDAIQIDYGNGSCDNIFTVSIGDRSKEISLN